MVDSCAAAGHAALVVAHSGLRRSAEAASVVRPSIAASVVWGDVECQ
jgi:hypothetical protein